MSICSSLSHNRPHARRWLQRRAPKRKPTAQQLQSSPSVAATAQPAHLPMRRSSHPIQILWQVCLLVTARVAAPFTSAVGLLEKAQQIQVIFHFHPLHHLWRRSSSLSFLPVPPKHLLLLSLPTTFLQLSLSHQSLRWELQFSWELLRLKIKR